MKYARELTAIIGGPITVWIIGWSHPYIFDVTIAVVAALALYEFLLLGRKKGYDIPIRLCLMVMLFIMAAFGRVQWYWVGMAIVAGAGLTGIDAIQAWINA